MYNGHKMVKTFVWFQTLTAKRASPVGTRENTQLRRSGEVKMHCNDIIDQVLAVIIVSSLFANIQCFHYSGNRKP